MSTKDEKHDMVEGVPVDSDSEAVTWTEAEETAVRRKLDFQIVPLITFLYLLCFLDRYVSLISPY